MIIVLVVLVVLLVGVLVALATQRIPALGVEAAVTTESFPGVPDGPLHGDDLAQLRFDQVLRGYRMSQVDRVLDRLAGELAIRDAEIARLREADTDGDL